MWSRICSFDKELEIDDNHKVTKGLKETVTDFAQMMPFAEVKETLKKHLGIEISAATIQKISESVGKELFEKEKKEARDIYENQYKAISSIEEANKKGRLYIECDGSMLVMRGDGWKEIKLGMVFSDNMVLNKNKPRHILRWIIHRFFPMLIEIIYFHNPYILKIDNFLITINVFQLCMERTYTPLTSYNGIKQINVLDWLRKDIIKLANNKYSWS